MKSEIAAKLHSINFQFYQTFANPFSATRQKINPGVRSILNGILPDTRILDVGCGNGNFLHELARQGFGGSYIGLDFSPALLQQATYALSLISTNMQLARFLIVDISEAGWSKAIDEPLFDHILAFAVLHHLPGADRRRKFLLEISDLLVDLGQFSISVWQPTNSDRLKARIQSWEAAGIAEAEVDIGDYLLDWRSGGSGLRYVHQFNPEELDELAALSGFSVESSWFSDGKEGNLGLYQIWKKK